jgi:glycerophosphoryl diester phosphodiesterase
VTRVIGHRGAGGLWPENSLGGFRNVITLAVDAVEFDVQLVDSGALLVIHDATIERTTEGTGAVRDLSPEKRARLRLKGCDETIPTFGEVLDVLAPAEEKQLHVEIKDPGDRLCSGVVEKIVAEIDHHGLRGRCHLSSFDLLVLEVCRSVASDIPRLVSLNAASANRLGGLESFLSRASDLVEVVAVYHEYLEANWDAITAVLSADRLDVWTLNDEALIRTWLDRGVGHITSDRPDLVLALRDEPPGPLPATENH